MQRSLEKRLVGSAWTHHNEASPELEMYTGKSREDTLENESENHREMFALGLRWKPQIVLSSRRPEPEKDGETYNRM